MKYFVFLTVFCLFSLWGPLFKCSTLLRIRPQVWEVDDNLDDVVSLSIGLLPVDETFAVPSLINEEMLDDTDDTSSSSEDDVTVGLCVLPKNCINRDGAGLIEPRKNRCVKPRIFCPVDDLEDYPLCGISRPNLVHDRILSTTSANSAFGEWPWVVMITERRGDDSHFLCNGVLIDDLHLVTVAHCFDKLMSAEIFIRLGQNDVEVEAEEMPWIEIEADVITLHSDYTARNLRNDIAVIRLKHAAPLTANIAPICLPSPIEVRQFMTTFSSRQSARCLTTGWGLNSPHKNTPMSAILKKVSVPLVEQSRCQKLLRKTKLGRRFELHRSFLCAGGEEGKDACFGDGGNPLMCQQDDGSFTLVGLTSWGVSCGQKNVPGVYVNVAEYVDFIEQSKEFMAEEDD